MSIPSMHDNHVQHHWEEARQQTETAKHQAALMAVPFRVRNFDEVGSEEFVAELRTEVLQLFDGSTVPETIQSLNQALELLEVHASAVNKLCYPWAEYQRSEEHTSELQSLMRTSYTVLCMTQKKSKK